MSTKLETFINSQQKPDLPDIRPGDTIRVYQKIKESPKQGKSSKESGERIQVFEGQVLCRKHRKEIGATITVRKVISGIGVEKIFPIHSPNIKKIEILRRGKTRRAKLYYLRKSKGKRAKLKIKEFIEAPTEEQEKPEEKVEEVKAKEEK